MVNGDMRNIQTEIELATTLVQSSIIKPRYRDEDILFSTIGVYEDDNLLQHMNSNLAYVLPGSNNILFVRSNYTGALFYTLMRRILAIFFSMYRFFLLSLSISLDLIDKGESLFWCLLSFLPFPEDVSEVGPAAVYSSTSVDKVSLGGEEAASHSINVTSLREDMGNHLKSYGLLPTRIGNRILEKSLMASVPRNRLHIRRVTASWCVPYHMCFIFEMSPLVVPQPQEVPTPYLDFDKKMVVPDKKDIAKVLSKRAEWSSLHHTHKAAEKFRLVYEASKCIAWAACSGVRIVTVFESNGYAWLDMPKIATVVYEEINSLTDSSYSVFDNIKLVNLQTAETYDVFPKESKIRQLDSNQFGNNKEFDPNLDGSQETYKEVLEEVVPAPEPIVSYTCKTEAKIPLDARHMFRTNLTVFFQSNKDSDTKQVLAHKVKRKICDILNKKPSLNSKSLKHSPLNPVYIDLEQYVDPEIIYRFHSFNQNPNSLTGYPLVPLVTGTKVSDTVATKSLGTLHRDTRVPIFISQGRPVNFAQFVKGIMTFHEMLKRG